MATHFERRINVLTMMFGREHFINLVLIFVLLTNKSTVYAFSSSFHFHLRPTNSDTTVVASSRSIHVNCDVCRGKHAPTPMLSLKLSYGSAEDESTLISTISANSNTKDSSTLTEVNLDWKMWYENAVFQIHTMQQQVNAQIQALMNQIEELQQRLESMVVELRNKNLQIEQAKNETMSWQTLYHSMRRQHLSEIEAIQNQYDTYVQNQSHEQVWNQIQYQRLQQQVKGQNFDYQSDLQQLQLQHENEKLLLLNDHKLLVQQLQANATLREQELLDQSKREISLQLRQQEELLDTTIVEPLRRELQHARNDLRTANNVVLQSQEHIAELERSQQSLRFLLSKLSGVCKIRIAALSPQRWLFPKFRRRTPPQSSLDEKKLTTVDMPS
jgi:myosin heavy subunit